MLDAGGRNIRRLWLGQTTSQVGDWFLRVALPLYVLARTGSAIATGVTFLATYVPGLLIGPAAGSLVEGFDYRATMIGADLVRAGLVSVLWLQPGSKATWVVCPVTALQAGVSEFFAPARTALIPRLVEAETLGRANGTMAIGSELALLVGPALGGLTYGWGGLRAAVVVDVLSYVVSATSTSLLSRTSPRRVGRTRLSVVATVHSLGSGLALAGREPLLRALFSVNLVMSLGAGILSVAIVTFARRHLGVTGFQYGTMLSAQAIGGMVGAWLSRRVSGALSNKAWLLLSYALVGSAVAGVAASNRWWVAALVLFAGGAPTTISTVVVTIVVQITPPPDFRARIASVYRWTSMAGLALGSLVAGPLAGQDGSQAALAISAALIGASVLLAGWLMPGPIRKPAPSVASIPGSG